MIADYRKLLFGSGPLPNNFAPLPKELPDYPQGSLGLMVWNSTASFRNVVVEPLDGGE